MATERPTLAKGEMIAGPRNGITWKKIEEEIEKRNLRSGRNFRLPSRRNGVITIESYDFTQRSGEKQLNLEGKHDVIIQYCKFGNKSTHGQGLNIAGKDTRNVTVQYCIFEDFSYSGDNEGEPLKIGDSQDSSQIFECKVKNNIFRKCKQDDPELISIKACKNTIEDNFFIDNKECNVTVRHGGLNRIEHNYFKGSNGVRIHGRGNYVGYNCFEDNKEEGKFSPITVRGGKDPEDENWENNKPKKNKRSSHHETAPARDTVIEGNEFKDCKDKIKDFKDGGEDNKPTGTEERNNNRVEKFTFDRGD